MPSPHQPLADALLERLVPLGEEITGKPMFGGYGFWASGDMFALITSEGVFHLKADDTTSARYRRARSTQFAPVMHNRTAPTVMPYWRVPKAVLADDDRLLEWAREAVGVAHATAKPPKRARTTEAAATPPRRGA